jgi:hypothetical protein
MNFMSIANVALPLVAMAFPQAGPVIGIVQKALPYILPTYNIIKEAIDDGPKAYEAAKKAAPDLHKAITDLAKLVFNTETPTKAQLENTTRTLYGFRPMTFDEEERWFASQTPSPHAP